MAIIDRRWDIPSVALVVMSRAVDSPPVPAMAIFESIGIIYTDPADAPFEAILVVKIPALKFPVSFEPTGTGPRPGIRIVSRCVIRPVLDFVRRGVRRAKYEKTGSDHQ